MATKMRVAVTGVAGHLGSHLVPLMVQEGFEVVGLDLVDPPDAVAGMCEFVKTDLTDIGQVEAVLDGVQMAVHCASIHPWKTYTDAQYLDNNVKGTWNVYAAAAGRGVNRIVLTSSIAAIGYGGPAAWPVREDVMFSLADLYSFTKHAQEDTARLFAETDQVRTLALRPPAFMPFDDLRTGFSLTGAYAVVEDIAAAHLAAVRVLAGRQAPGEPPFDAAQDGLRGPEGDPEPAEGPQTTSRPWPRQGVSSRSSRSTGLRRTSGWLPAGTRGPRCRPCTTCRRPNDCWTGRPNATSSSGSRR